MKKLFNNYEKTIQKLFKNYQKTIRLLKVSSKK